MTLPCLKSAARTNRLFPLNSMSGVRSPGPTSLYCGGTCTDVNNTSASICPATMGHHDGRIVHCHLLVPLHCLKLAVINPTPSSSWRPLRRSRPANPPGQNGHL